MTRYLFILFALAIVSSAGAAETTRAWPFNGSLAEHDGGCAFAVRGAAPTFVEDDGRAALALAGGCCAVNDDPLYDLASGMRFACRVRFDELHPAVGWTTILRKSGDDAPGGFFLRVDHANEGEHLSFFINLDGSPEPRVSSREPMRTGVWYDLAAGWDGRNIWLSVNGDVTRTPRRGTAIGCPAPLTVGPLHGRIADLSFTNGILPLENDTRLAPGLRLTCSATFDTLPTGENLLLTKSGEYLLRYDVLKGDLPGQGCFCFWVHLNGSWEPRVQIREDVVLGHRYNISAAWNGTHSILSVDGRSATEKRFGHPDIGAPDILAASTPARVTNVAVRVRRIPLPRLSNFRTRELLPRAGAPFHVLYDLGNRGAVPLTNTVVVASVTPGATITPARIPVGLLAPEANLPLTWTIDPGTNVAVHATFSVEADGRRVAYTSRTLPLMPAVDPDLSARAWNPPVHPVRTFYVDARDGDDARDGTSPATAWLTFRNLASLTLGPGERLLLRRGSIFREELVLSARGAPENWAEIGAYGEGPRPQIRRNRHLDDRCVRINSPEFLAVRDLVVCDAGKGIDIGCVDSGRGGILVERCLAHHVEGLYRFNSHGIPEWRDCRGAPREGNGGGIAIVGPHSRNVVLRDCETYACSSGFNVTGQDVFVGRVFNHDSFRPNTSPHPFLTSTTRAWLVDSIFDASGWNASAGTMGIMLGNNDGLVIRGCHFLNQPHSGSGDEGGIDFEAGGDNCLIESCTFRNNAGAAIEVLGLRSPQAHNTHIRRCRFDRNNYRHILGPSEIFVWGGTTDPSVVCSSGLIEGNGYVLAPGVSFYTNQAERTRGDWRLVDNTAYATSGELDRALPHNNPPTVHAGDEIWSDASTVTLAGDATDDGKPANSRLALAWEQLEGPVPATFADAASAHATATFPVPGDYRLLLRADDGELWRTSRTAVHVLPRGARVKRAWTFAKDLDTEGWAVFDAGTEKEYFTAENPLWNTFANPVDIAAGDCYTLAVKASATARLATTNALDLVLAATDRAVLRLQNHTDSTAMRLVLTLDDEREFLRSFPVTPNDIEDTVYVVPINVEGRLHALRLDLSADARPITGTIRLDYVWLGTSGAEGEVD